MTTLLAVATFAALSAFPAVAEEPASLPSAEKGARKAVEEYRESGKARHKSLERLRKDLRYMSEVLDREIVSGQQSDLPSLSRGALARIAEMRRNGNVHPDLFPTLDRLEALYRSLPGRAYAEHYPRSLVKSIAHELRWIAETAKTKEELLSLLDEHLVLPDGEVDALGFLKENVPVGEFVRQGPIKVFIAKHRLKRPKSHAAAAAAEIVGGRHNVQVGVLLQGVVTHHTKFQIDGDYTFDFGSLHIELTPEWRATHPDLPRPVTGDRICLRGWTYYDSFHKDEEEYDPEDPLLGIARATVWEVHPVLDIQTLKKEEKCAY